VVFLALALGFDGLPEFGVEAVDFMDWSNMGGLLSVLYSNWIIRRIT